MIQQLLLTYRASLMEQQVFQHAGLLPGQCKGLPLHRGDPASGIEGQPAAAQAHVLLDEPPPGQAADPCLQLRQMKGLGQIVVCPGVQSLHLVGDLAAGRKDQHAGLKVLLPQGPQHLHPVHPGQVQVQQYQIVPLRRQHFQRRFPIAAAVHLVTGQPQLPGDILL